MATGLDLLILSLLTSIGFAASQYSVEIHARAHQNIEAVVLAERNQDDALRIAAFAFLLFVLVSWLIQWWGQWDREDQLNWKRAKLNAMIASLATDDESEQSKIDLALHVPEPPRFKFWLGHFAPTSIGLLMLLLTIETVTQ